MTDISLPRLLADDLTEIRRITPVTVSVTQNLTGPSEASVTLADDDEAPPMHSLMEIFTERGSVGIFRVTNIARGYRQEISLTLRHAIDFLSDALWKAQEDFSGTMTQYLTRLLSFQTVEIDGAAAWQLGTCSCTSTVKKSMNYERLSALLEAVESDESDYCFDYDFTTSPWTVNFIAKPSAVSAEFRLNRNATDCTVTLDDSDLCNSLRLSANHTNVNSSGQKTSVDTVYKDYSNATSQAAWGVVEKVADIDVDEDVKNGAHAECDAWAARFLAERADPSVQIEIDGLDLKKLTDDEWDEPEIGEKCRVALPEYGGAVFTERVVSITWPDVYGDPLRITVSLANTLPKFSETLAKVSETAKRAGRVSRRNEREVETKAYWDLVVRDIVECVDGTGIDTLYETGIVLDAHSGATIYSIMEGLQALNSTLKISHNGVESLVMASGAILDANGNPVLDQDGNVQFSTGANCLYSQIRQTADEVTSQIIQAGTVAGLQAFDATKNYAVGDMVLYNNNSYVFTTAHPAGPWDASDVSRIVPLSSRVQQTESSWSTTVQAIGAGGAITAASIVAAVNATSGDSIVQIDANHIILSGAAVASSLLSEDLGCDGLDVGAGAVTIDNTGYIDCSGITINGDTLDGSFADWIVDASVSGNTLTLTKFDGSSVTFSKAAASPTIGGGWASGVYTVTSDVTPAAGSEMSTTLYDLGLGSSWTLGGSGTSQTLTNTFDIGYAAIVSGQQVRGGSTGKTGSITVPIPLQTKTFSSVGTKTPDSGYAGFSQVTINGQAGTISAATPVSTQPTGNLLRTVTVGTGGNKSYVKVSATGSRNNNDYIEIRY